MDIIEAMNAGGYKPKMSTEGIWEPYKGTYKVEWKVCRLETDEKNGNVKYIQAEWNILETIDGMDKRESKYSDFRKRYYIEGDKGQKNWETFKDHAFTFGVDVSRQDDFAQLIGKVGYVKAYGWTPEGKDAVQMINVIQEKVAIKAKKENKLGF